MRKSTCLSNFVIASALFLFAACSSNDQPVQPPAPAVTSLALSDSVHVAYLVPGGFLLPSATDTEVCFDVMPLFFIKNLASVSVPVTIQWEYGVKGSDSVIHYDQIRELNHATATPGRVPAKGTLELDPMDVIAIPTALRGMTIYTRLTLLDSNANVALTNVSAFDSVPFDLRYRGIFHTTASSPGVIDTLDGPDDGDWKGGDKFFIEVASPNPFSGTTASGFQVATLTDSVRILFQLTPRKEAMPSLLFQQIPAGVHPITFDFSSVPHGLYRALFKCYQGDNITVERGDLMVE